MRRNVRQQFDHVLKAFGIRRSNRSKDTDSCDRYETLLTGYADGELDQKRRQVVEGHLNACADCRASLAATRLSSRAMFECPRATFTGDMSARLRIAIAEEARKSTRIPLWTAPRLAMTGAAFAVLVAAAVFVGVERSGTPTHVAINSPLHTNIGIPTQPPVPTKPVTVNPAQAQVASEGSVGNGVSTVPATTKPSIAVKPHAHTEMVASALVAKPIEHISKPFKPSAMMASLPHIAPSVNAPTPKVDRPTQVAVMPASAADNNAVVQPSAPVETPVVRAPDNTVASNPAEPNVLTSAVDIEPVDQPSLAMRLRHSAHLTAVTTTERVSVRGARYAGAENGTAVLVGSGFYSH